MVTGKSNYLPQSLKLLLTTTPTVTLKISKPRKFYSKASTLLTVFEEILEFQVELFQVLPYRFPFPNSKLSQIPQK
jgi:hypothetical protein